MKANESPEKIYLQQNTTTDCYGEWWPEWFEARAKDDDIEYTRTDAFIEKAYEWIKENHKEYIIVDIDDKYVGVDGLFFEEFRKYMKGE